MLNKWKAIKINGNDRKKRRDLIQRILSSSSNIPARDSYIKKITTPELTETAAAVNNISIHGDGKTANLEHEDIDWDVELDDHNFPEVAEEATGYINEFSFLDDLKQWSVKHCIRHVALNDLLKILNALLPDFKLPKDARTVMSTPASPTNIVSDGQEGSYWHYGLQKVLGNSLSQIKIHHGMNLSLNINVDGLPIYRSSRIEFWPILVNIFEIPKIPPMIVGIYCGKGKPKDVNYLMKSTVDDLNALIENGMVINEKKISFQIRCFICDTPARSFLKGVIASNGYYGCLKCEVKGKYCYNSNKVIYTDLDAPKRTDENFRSGVYMNHKKNDTVLMNLPIDIVADFPIGDSLHIIDLGITKRLLNGWKFGNLNNHNAKWSAMQWEQVSFFMKKCKMPSEIKRAVRGLDDLSHWKGSEYRTFLLYIGIVVVPKFFADHKIVDHFLLYFCAIIICSRSDQCTENYNVAEEMLRNFLKNFKTLYGIEHFSSNLHNLVHIVDDVRKFGALDTFSAYPFESKLFHIKRLLRSGNLPLSQVAKRISEQQEAIFFSKDDFE